MDFFKVNRKLVDKKEFRGKWDEYYRPETRRELCLPDSILDIIFNSDSNILLYSDSGGTGKTSVSQVMTNDMNIENPIRKNGANIGIDMMRNQITDYAKTPSLNGNKKIVAIDEFDRISLDAKDHCKALLETPDVMRYTRFVATTNFIGKIPSQLRARFTVIDLNFPSSEKSKVKGTKEYKDKLEWLAKIKVRLSHIMKDNDMVLENDNTIMMIMREFKNNVRMMVKILQEIHDDTRIDNSCITADDIERHVINARTRTDNTFLEFLLTLPDEKKLYSKVSSCRGQEVSIMSSLGSPMMNYLRRIDFDKYAGKFLEISKYHTELNHKMNVYNSDPQTILYFYCCILVELFKNDN